MNATLTAAVTALQDRVDALEIKASFAEDTVEQLNQVIIRQQDELDGLKQQVVQLRVQVRTQSSESGGAASPRDDLPPHY